MTLSMSHVHNFIHRHISPLFQTIAEFKFEFEFTPFLIRLRIHTKMTSSSSPFAEKVATFASVTGVEDQSTSRRILKVYY